MTEYQATLEEQPAYIATLPTGTVIPAPQPGWSLEFQTTATHLEIRQVRGEELTEWVQVIAFEELVGPAGAVPVFAVVDGALAYRFGDSGPWGQLLTIASLKGDNGLSAYQLWIEAGNVGTVVEFLESLKGVTPELPAFVASSTVGVVGSVPTVAAEEVDGEVRFKFVLPPPRDGVSPTPPTLSLTVGDAAEGAGSSGSLTAAGSQWNVSLLLRRGAQGQQGPKGEPGTAGASTGWRNISALLDPAKWNTSTARLFVLRIGNTVMVQGAGVPLVAFWDALIPIPVGFRPAAPSGQGGIPGVGNTNPQLLVRANGQAASTTSWVGNGFLQQMGPAIAANSSIVWTGVFLTLDAPPTEPYTGTPA